MKALTDLEFRILDELYFLSSFNILVQNLNEERTTVTEALKKLLSEELITQMKLDKGIEIKCEQPDFDALEESHFVASKKGLLLHNSRN